MTEIEKKKFSNLLGTVYKQGNVQFTSDGNTVISPVGNKVTLYDLKNHLSETLPIESILNIAVVTLNPAGTHLLLVNDGGEALYVSLISKTILHRHRFHKKVNDVRFSPDGRKIAVCRDSDVQILRAPGIFAHQYNPFVLEETYKIANDVTTCLDWSDDSSLLAAGSADMQVRVCAGRRVKNVYITALGGHKGPIIACFFDADSFDLMTIDRKGFLNRWECNIDADDLVEGNPDKDTAQSGNVKMINFEKTSRHSFHDAVPGSVHLTAAAYHKKNRLLITGFSNGAFVLHEMPDFNLIHNLSVSEQAVRTVAMNASGDWLAIGCGTGVQAQLLVWEWQSETYVMKQQGHAQTLTTLAYSPDGSSIATGAEDGSVKVWSTKTGFCVVTFTEHQGGVTGVTWTQAGKAVLSASLDGSVRAFDLKRYRNFRTLVCPEPTQLSCLAVDSSGEIVVAGAQDVFDVFVWSLQNGRLLDVLSGHTAPVSAVAFNPAHAVMASVSWDKTIRVWDVFEGKASAEAIHLTDEGLDVTFSPDGRLVAAVALDSQMTWFEWRDSVQTGSVEGRLDLEAGRGKKDHITAKKSGASKSLSTIDYSADGDYLLAAGQSKFICLYHTGEQVLVKKFQITHNLSLDAVADDIDRRQFTEFGNMALIDASDSEEEADGKKKIKLAGARVTDMSERTIRPEIRVTCVQFSPAGRSFAACTTEGLLIYSLDDTIMFDPFQLGVDITPAGIRAQVAKGEMGSALTMALRLNQSELIAEVIEATPVEEVSLICQSLPLVYVEKFLFWLGTGAGVFDASNHVHFYMLWVKHLLYHHGPQLKLRSAENVAALTGLQDIISRKHVSLAKLSEQCKYGLNYLATTRRLRGLDVKEEVLED